MIRKFIEAAQFIKSWSAMDLTDIDLKRLQEQLLDDPDMGKVIQGTGGARKLRFSFEHQGKSGSSRVIYVDIVVKETIYLLFAYPKNKQDNLTESQKKQIRELIKILKEE